MYNEEFEKIKQEVDSKSTDELKKIMLDYCKNMCESFLYAEEDSITKYLMGIAKQSNMFDNTDVLSIAMVIPRLPTTYEYVQKLQDGLVVDKNGNSVPLSEIQKKFIDIANNEYEELNYNIN